MSIPRAPKPTFTPNPTIRLCPVCVPSPAFRPTSRAPPAHFRAQPHDSALPCLRTFARISTSQPPQAYALSRPTARPGFVPSAHIRPHSDPLVAPRLHTFAPNPTTRLCPVCAPSPVFLRTSRPELVHLRLHYHALAAPRLRTFAPNPTIRLCPVCAPPSSLLRTFSPTSTYFFTRFYGPVRQIIKRIYTNHLKYSYKSFKRVI